MNKLIFITGLPGTGKSTYIRQQFSGKKDYYVFDLSLQSRQLFGTPLALENEDKIADIYNMTSEEALIALMEGKNLVIEFGKGRTYHDDFENLLNMARGMGLRVEQKHFDQVYHVPATDENMENYSSFLYAYESLEVLEGVLESYKINQELESVLDMVTEDGFLKILSMMDDNGSTVYFHVSEKTDVFDFEEKEDYKKPEGIDYRKIYNSFEEALESMLASVSVLKVSPTHIAPSYQAVFHRTYHHHLSKMREVSSPTIFFAPYN